MTRRSGAQFRHGFRSSQIVTESGATRTLSTDAGKYIICTNAAGCSLTAPALAAGDVVFIEQALGAGEVTITGSGVTLLKPASKDAATAEAGAVLALVYKTSSTATLIGHLGDA